MPEALIDGVAYQVEKMAEAQAQEWMELRIMSWWRQLVLFRSVSAVVLGAIPDNFENPPAVAAERNLERDEHIHKICGEYITINNHLVARALKGVDPEVVRSLRDDEKQKVLAIQDKLNGLDLLKQLAAMEDKANTARPSIDAVLRANEKRIEQDELKRGLRIPTGSRKLTKKISKIVAKHKAKK